MHIWCRSKALHVGCAAILACFGAAGAEANEPDAQATTAAAETADASEAAATVRARDDFVRGAALVRNAQWAEALVAFESSAAVVPHHVTTFNIAVCERALGLYVRARRTLSRAQQQSQASPQPDSAFLSSVDAYIAEVERLVARVRVELEPADAAIAVDGRPLLAAVADDGSATLVAGVAPPGRGRTVSKRAFDMLVDPGAHVIIVTRRGFGDVVFTRTFKPGDNRSVKLELSKLPATLRIDANRDGAVVRVNGVDVGIAPVAVSRPAGRYEVSVHRPGFADYTSRVTVHAGDEANLSARLQPLQPALTSRWWFWTAVGGAVAATAVTTYLVTKPDPERPPVDGGGLDWALEVP